MFLDFLLFLRAGGLKVSLDEWLSITEGIYMGLHGQTLKGFYILSRALLVKKENDLDKFEELFYQYFKSVNSQRLKKEIKKLLNQPERAEQIFKSYMDQRKLEPQVMMEKIEMRINAAEEGYGENIAVNAEGVMNSSVSAGKGAGPGPGNGTMIQGAGGKSIVHAPGNRRFRDWRTDCTIESRQYQMAFRLLRELSRKLETNEEELDIRGTIDHTCRQGGILDIKMQPPRKNRLKLMVLIDSGGSMKPYEQLCSLLFQSLNKANTFSDLKIYYFHNCLEGKLYTDPSIDIKETVKTEWILRNVSSDYKLIFVGDADMAMHELVDNNSYSRSSNTDLDGITWFKKFSEKYEHSIWLHPQEREENLAWMSESFTEINKIFPMFRLSIDGLKDGMYKLMRNQ